MFENIVIGFCIGAVIIGSVCCYIDYATAGAWKR